MSEGVSEGVCVRVLQEGCIYMCHKYIKKK